MSHFTKTQKDEAAEMVLRVVQEVGRQLRAGRRQEALELAAEPTGSTYDPVMAPYVECREGERSTGAITDGGAHG